MPRDDSGAAVSGFFDVMTQFFEPMVRKQEVETMSRYARQEKDIEASRRMYEKMLTGYYFPAQLEGVKHGYRSDLALDKLADRLFLLQKKYNLMGEHREAGKNPMKDELQIEKLREEIRNIQGQITAREEKTRQQDEVLDLRRQIAEEEKNAVKKYDPLQLSALRAAWDSKDEDFEVWRMRNQHLGEDVIQAEWRKVLKDKLKLKREMHNEWFFEPLRLDVLDVWEGKKTGDRFKMSTIQKMERLYRDDPDIYMELLRLIKTDMGSLKTPSNESYLFKKYMGARKDYKQMFAEGR